MYQTHLLRRSYRQEGKVKHETLGNLSHLPADLIDTIRGRLSGKKPPEAGHFEIVRSLPHGHVAAVLGTLRKIGLETVLSSRCCIERTRVVAMIVARIIQPGSKLATARAMSQESASSSLGQALGIKAVSAEELYQAMDWLGKRQKRIENKLAKKHLEDGSLILYDVSSSYYTGSHCSLAKFGHSRDGKKGFPQILYGLLCNSQGCPVAIEVFEGNTADPNTLASQIHKVRKRFALKRVVFVGDRGMITAKRIDEELRGVIGLDWITALRAESIKQLAEQGVVQSSLFDKRDLVEVSSPDYPGERLVVCRNPFLAEQRARRRKELLEATEKDLNAIVAATQRTKRALKGKDKIGIRVGKVINKRKMGKHFVLEIEEARFAYHRNEEKIAEEARLDGLYVIRASVPKDTLSSESTVRAYKDLSRVERAFRCLKTIDLHVRPVFHRIDDRVRAHVFLCMLAYYVEWHMRPKLAPVLFDDEDKELAESLRVSVVAAAERSGKAKWKDQTKRTQEDYPVHSFRSLLEDLKTLCKNRIRVAGERSCEFYQLTEPTDVQRRALELLGVSPSL